MYQVDGFVRAGDSQVDACRARLDGCVLAVESVRRFGTARLARVGVERNVTVGSDEKDVLARHRRRPRPATARAKVLAREMPVVPVAWRLGRANSGRCLAAARCIGVSIRMERDRQHNTAEPSQHTPLRANLVRPARRDFVRGHLTTSILAHSCSRDLNRECSTSIAQNTWREGEEAKGKRSQVKSDAVARR